MLSARKQKILKNLLETHHFSGKPVASLDLAKKTKLGLSSATLRHELAELEELGYLHHPHASAGRVPTEQGYRFYINELLTSKPLEKPDEEKIRELNSYPSGQMDDFLHEALQTLTLLSHYTGIAVAPRLSQSVLSHIDFISVSPKKVLALLVSRSGMVKHKMINLKEAIAEEDLKKISSFIQESFKGLTLDEVRLSLLNKLERDKETYRDLLKQTIALCKECFTEEATEEVIVEGIPSILDDLDLEEEEERSILNFLSHPFSLGTFFHEHNLNPGVEIFIGSESPFREMRHLSMVLTPYEIGGHPIGALGIIGPMRMEYERVVPLLEYTARSISDYLNERF